MPIDPNQTLAEALREGFLSFAQVHKDGREKDLFLRYYRKEGAKFLREKLPRGFLETPIKDLTFNNISTLLEALEGAIAHRMETNQKANRYSLIVNSAACAVSLISGMAAYYGLDNGGCNIDTEGKFDESFYQQPVPSVVMGSLSAALNTLIISAAFRIKSLALLQLI